MITRGRIIGKERTRDKLEQLRRIADEEDLPFGQVWRLNDRYDPSQQEQIRDSGFPYQFLVEGGYMFPHDLKNARQDPMVIVVPRKGLAKALGQKAEEWHF
jgi:hypothetical protein